MRNVTPSSDPDMLLRRLEVDDDLKKYMKARYDQLTHELNAFLSDISLGLHKRVGRYEERYEKQLYDIEVMVREMREKQRKKEERGRPVLVFGDAAPSTPTENAARIAA